MTGKNPDKEPTITLPRRLVIELLEGTDAVINYLDNNYQEIKSRRNNLPEEIKRIELSKNIHLRQRIELNRKILRISLDQ